MHPRHSHTYAYTRTRAYARARTHTHIYSIKQFNVPSRSVVFLYCVVAVQIKETSKPGEPTRYVQNWAPFNLHRNIGKTTGKSRRMPSWIALSHLWNSNWSFWLLVKQNMYHLCRIIFLSVFCIFSSASSNSFHYTFSPYSTEYTLHKFVHCSLNLSISMPLNSHSYIQN